MAALRTYWREGHCGVLALVGLGGAGKTAVAARFIDELMCGGLTPRADGLFVWSFYHQPDAGLFLREAYRYFARDDAPVATAKGSGILHLLHEALAVGGPHLLVLDGVERVQGHGSAGDFGQIEDPLLKGLLIRLAEGVGRAAAVVTSRFPLTDLTPLQGKRFRVLEVGGIDPDAARALLRRRGVAGDDAALNGLIDAYGAHALTLDHLGGVIGQFLGGDARRAPEAPALAGPAGDQQARRWLGCCVPMRNTSRPRNWPCCAGFACFAATSPRSRSGSSSSARRRCTPAPSGSCRTRSAACRPPRMAPDPTWTTTPRRWGAAWKRCFARPRWRGRKTCFGKKSWRRWRPR